MSRLPVEGETFGRYRLLRRLGHGGMGVVYAALDEVLNREVALKLVAPHLADDEEFRARFAREAEVLARLDSDRAVRIFDHGEQDGVLFISTQLIEGGDLASLMREAGALSPALAVAVVAQMLEGLEDAHKAGIVHRDVKPANVLVRQRGGEIEAYLCDFGIATTAGASLTRTGSVAGSLPYMAPERHHGEDAGPGGDLYSAGCLFWFALTGQPPYVGSEAQVLMGHVQGKLPQLPGKDPFSKRANAVLAKALAKDVRKRYPSAAAMRADLEALKPLAAGSLQLPGATAVRHAVPTRPRRRWVAPVVAVAAVLAIIGGTIAVQALGDDAGPEPEAVEITRLLPGQNRNLEPQRTLMPRPGQEKATVPAGPGEGITDAEGVVVVPSAGPGGGEQTVPHDGGSPAPQPTRTTSSPAPAPTSSPPPPPPPTYAYRCWDSPSHLTNDPGTDCSYPYGRTGANWMLPKAAGWSCKLDSNPAASGAYEKVYCPRTGGAVSLFRFSSYATGWSFLQGSMSGGFDSTWETGGKTAGRSRVGQKDGRYRWGRVWYSNGQTWVVWVDMDTRSRRDDAINSTGLLRYRYVDYQRWMPCSVEGSGC